LLMHGSYFDFQTVLGTMYTSVKCLDLICAILFKNVKGEIETVSTPVILGLAKWVERRAAPLVQEMTQAVFPTHRDEGVASRLASTALSMFKIAFGDSVLGYYKGLKFEQLCWFIGGLIKILIYCLFQNLIQKFGFSCWHTKIETLNFCAKTI